LVAGDIELGEYLSRFSVKSEILKINEDFQLKIPGLYNVSNALGVVLLGAVYGISMGIVGKVFSEFDGIARRMEAVGEKRNIRVYDDYAHHPTAIQATLGGLRQKYPENRIWAVVEPHTFSRTKALLKLYKHAFDKVDKVIIAPIFRSRDSEDYGVSGQSIVDAVGSEKVVYLDSFDKIVQLIKSQAVGGDRVIVMGAGKSSELARDIFNSL
jgi:UDP-N-acetylmuramate--alanine ligase